MSKSEIYVPIEDEILQLTDGTPIRVQRVYDGHITASRVDNLLFTKEQTGDIWATACWQFNGRRGDSSNSYATGLNFVLPNSKQALELKVQQLGGTVTWTDPDILKAREIWAKHARPSGGPDSKLILQGEFDTGTVMQAILEAIRTTKGI